MKRRVEEIGVWFRVRRRVRRKGKREQKTSRRHERLKLKGDEQCVCVCVCVRVTKTGNEGSNFRGEQRYFFVFCWWVVSG